MAINEVVLIGRLCFDPELREINSDTKVTNLLLAVDKPYREGKETEANFIDVTAWGKTAENICKFFGKGDPIAIKGRLETQNYEDEEENKKKSTKVIVEKFEFINGNRKSEKEINEESTKKTKKASKKTTKVKKDIAKTVDVEPDDEEYDEDNLPF